MFLGEIFAGYDIISCEDVTIKFESQSSKYLHLEDKYNIYKSIGNHIGVPCLKWFGQEHNQRVLVLSLLGLSLENIFVASGCRCYGFVSFTRFTFLLDSPFYFLHVTYACFSFSF